ICKYTYSTGISMDTKPDSSRLKTAKTAVKMAKVKSYCFQKCQYGKVKVFDKYDKKFALGNHQPVVLQSLILLCHHSSTSDQEMSIYRSRCMLFTLSFGVRSVKLSPNC